MKVRLLLYFLSILFLASCGSARKVKKRKSKPVKKVQVEPRPVKLPSVNQQKHVKKLEKTGRKFNTHTLSYIKKYAPLAVREMHKYKIPASITLAQGILESGSGRSQLASKSKNHFGIKCHTTWRGARVYHDDDEKGECFRKYQYVESSYKDHSLFLTQRRRYAFLFSYGMKNYKKWAKGLKKAGYATDPRYPKKLINLIENYELHKFDDVKKKNFKYVVSKEPVVVEKRKRKSRTKTYKVRKGDTLYSISRRYGLSVKELKRLNRLKNNTISIGQVLKLK
ncbi:MAG: N-acetylmuramidase [Flavobacteriaceae bacterium]|nr:N-acetylmuramidase [Flavobacteriaceae bacterium]|tara:strand:- start:43810 stop:44652 length:843 start_codon:yes stop_codon:yes gene_type:complete